MLDASPILWLQQWSSPVLTALMLAVSALGYVPVALAAALSYGYRRRLSLGVALIVALLYADALTTMAKAAVHWPRPPAVDMRVQQLQRLVGAVVLPPGASSKTTVDDFGFPSGHVATATVMAVGLIGRRKTALRLAMAMAWIGVMALSRLYLGRHFPIDVAGGFIVGLVALGLARSTMTRTQGEPAVSPAGRRWLAASIGVVSAVPFLWAATVGADDAGRFVGAFVALACGAALHVAALLVPSWRSNRAPRIP